MKILITGISGFIGRTLMESVYLKYPEIIGLDKENLSDGNDKLKEFIKCDLGNKDETVNIDKDVDIIVHLAGESNVRANKEKHIRNNYLGSLNLLNGADKINIKKIIFLSSNKVGNESYYGNTKSDAESEIIKFSSLHDSKFTILRSAIVYGPGMRSSMAKWILHTRRKLFPQLPTSHSVVEMISDKDLCKVIEICISEQCTDNKVYEISDGYLYNVNEIERKSREFFKTQNALFTVPKSLLYLLAKLGDMLAYVSIKLPINTDSYQLLFQNQKNRDMTFELDTGFQATQNFMDEIPNIFQKYK